MKYEIIAYSTTRITAYVTANSEEEAIRLWQLGLDDDTEYSEPTQFEIDEVNEVEEDSPLKAYSEYVIGMAGVIKGKDIAS